MFSAADITLSTTPVVFAAASWTGGDLSNSLTITANMDSRVEEDGEQLDLFLNNTNVIYAIGNEPSFAVTVISMDGEYTVHNYTVKYMYSYNNIIILIFSSIIIIIM